MLVGSPSGRSTIFISPDKLLVFYWMDTEVCVCVCVALKTLIRRFSSAKSPRG